MTRRDALGVAGPSVVSLFPMSALEPVARPCAVGEGGWEEAPLVEAAAAWVCESGCKEREREREARWIYNAEH